MRLRHWLIAVCIAACSSSSSPPSASAPSAAAPPVAAAPAPPAPIVPAPNPEPPPVIDAGAAPPSTTLAADGSDCLAASDCASGVCEGEGCDAAHPGHCAKAARICAHNRVQFCGCDNKTTTASSTCPRMRYASRGPCSAP